MQSPDLFAVKEELERILSSKLFKKASVLSNFLRYVVTETIEKKVHEIKEYSIAVKALGKPADFNPQIDAVIRINAGRLRRSLMEYYQEEGNSDPIVISLKKGSYIPVFAVMDKVDALPKSVAVSPVYDNLPVNRVAVLPFKNLSGLADNDFMVDGFCEQLSSDLAQFPEIAVISYYSTSKFRGERPDIRHVGRELNTSHLITGSVYRDKKHLRISMQLVNAVTGAQLWAQTYERTLNSSYLYDIFDDIIKQVVPRFAGYYGLINRNSVYSTQLDPSLDQNTIDAVFWYYHYQIRYTEETYQIARTRVEKALQQNPNYALAWAILGQLYIGGRSLCYSSVSDPLAEANKCIQNALLLDPDCQHAYLSLAYMFIFLRDKSSAVESLERCISINPRSPFFLGGASFLFSLLGEHNKSIGYFEQSNILNPYYPWWVNVGQIIIQFHNGNYDESLEFANRINIPGVFWNHVFKIAALGQLSRTKEAVDLASKFQIQFPGKAGEACSILKSILFDELAYDRIKEGLTKAGLPV